MRTWNRRRPTPGRCCVLVALVAGLAATAHADEAASDPAPRDFAGHLFIPTRLVPDPFISTSFSTGTGAGSAVNLVVPLYNVQGEKIAETSSNIAFMQLDFEYQQMVHRRVAVHAGLNGGGRLGTTTSSVLAEGVSALFGYGIGTVVNLTRKPTWQVAATLDVRGNTLYGVSPLDFARALRQAIAADDTSRALAAEDSLLSDGNSARFLGGVRGAYTPAPWIGFTAFLETGLGRKFKEEDDRVGVTNLGVAASFDLNPLKRIPIGLVGGFRNESLSEKNDDVGSAQAFCLSVFYTGRRFFALGLESTWSQIHQAQTDKKIDVAQTQFIVRYDFQ